MGQAITFVGSDDFPHNLMPLANFFDKSALAAAHVLKGISFSDYKVIVDAQNVSVSLPIDIATSHEGAVCAELTVNLLARLLPRLKIHTHSDSDMAFAERLRALALAINPDMEIGFGGDCGICIVVGTALIPKNTQVFFIGSNGWSCFFSKTEACAVGATNIPFGAAAAACFGVANLFRLLFGASLEGGGLDNDFSLSLLDYERNGQQPFDVEIENCDIGNIQLVGLGAIGNGAIWVLAKCPKLRGVIDLIDDEAVEITNLQRYVLATQADLNVSKVKLGQGVLEHTGLTVSAHPMPWGEFYRSTNRKLETILVALDSAADRIAVQASLPKKILNAWTQRDNIAVSRHTFDGDGPCLCCLYMPSGKLKNEDELISEALMIPADQLRVVRELLYRNRPPTAALLDQIAAANNVPVSSLLPFSELPLRQFYTHAVCGGAMLRLSPVTNREVDVPMAFQSALAGIMLAAEAVSSKMTATSRASTTCINLLRPLGSHLNVPESKHSSGKCICQDKDYISAYRSKWSEAE